VTVAPVTVAPGPGGGAVRERIVGVDAARAVALVGMASTHVLPLRDAAGQPTVTALVASGRSSALFAVLAGVGVALSLGRPADGRTHLAAGAAVGVRGLVVGLLGLVLVGLEPPVAVILAYYGLLFWVAVPLLRLPVWALAAGAVLVAAGAPVLSHLLRSGLPEGPGPQPGLAGLAEPVDLLRTLVLTGYYPVLPWAAYLLAGLAVGRLDLRRRGVALGLLGGGAALALAAAVASRLLVAAAGTALDPVALTERQAGTTSTGTWWWLAVDLPHSGTPFDLAHTTGTALAVLGLVLLVARAAAPLVWVPAAVGAVPLTLYALHVAVLAAFPARGAENPGAVLVAHVAGAVLVGVALRMAGTRGPGEWAVSGPARDVRAAVSRLLPPPRTSAPGSAPARPAPRAR